MARCYPWRDVHGAMLSMARWYPWRDGIPGAILSMPRCYPLRDVIITIHGEILSMARCYPWRDVTIIIYGEMLLVVGLYIGDAPFGAESEQFLISTISDKRGQSLASACRVLIGSFK